MSHTTVYIIRRAKNRSIVLRVLGGVYRPLELTSYYLYARRYNSSHIIGAAVPLAHCLLAVLPAAAAVRFRYVWPEQILDTRSENRPFGAKTTHRYRCISPSELTSQQTPVHVLPRCMSHAACCIAAVSCCCVTFSRSRRSEGYIHIRVC